MRILVISPIGVTRRVLENWLSPLGHKILSAEEFESATRQLTANPGIELVITEWLLGGQTAFDVFMKTKQITHVSDAAETSTRIHMIVIVTPGLMNSRIQSQMDVLRAADQVAFVEKPINREMIHQVLQKIFPPPAPKTPAATPNPASASEPPIMAEAGSAPTADPETNLLRQLVSTQQETLDYLAKLHADAQTKLQGHVQQR